MLILFDNALYPLSICNSLGSVHTKKLSITNCSSTFVLYGLYIIYFVEQSVIPYLSARYCTLSFFSIQCGFQTSWLLNNKVAKYRNPEMSWSHQIEDLDLIHDVIPKWNMLTKQSAPLNLFPFPIFVIFVSASLSLFPSPNFH